MAIIGDEASAKGEIALLSELAAPTMGLVTNIGKAHLQGLAHSRGPRGEE